MLPPTSRPSYRTLDSWLSDQTSSSINLFFHPWYMPYPSRPPWLYNSDYIWQRLQVTEFLTNQFSPASCYSNSVYWDELFWGIRILLGLPLLSSPHFNAYMKLHAGLCVTIHLADSDDTIWNLLHIYYTNIVRCKTESLAEGVPPSM
jgi:hypothetical protein